VRDGVLTRGAAERDYGVAIGADGKSLDRPERGDCGAILVDRNIPASLAATADGLIKCPMSVIGSPVSGMRREKPTRLMTRKIA
jgi:hypothetical protein